MNTELSDIYTRIDLMSDDGFPLKVYESNKPAKNDSNVLKTILVVNSINVGIELIAPLLESLSGFFRVVSWESRGTHLPDDVGEIRRDSFNVVSHIKDIKAILSHLDIDRVDHVIGYCSGGILASLAAKHLSEYDIESLLIISPPFNFDGAEKTKLCKTSVTISRQVAEKGESFAKLIADLFTNESVLKSSTDIKLDLINRAPYKAVSSTLTYSYFLDDLYRYDHEEGVQGWGENLFYLQAENDEYVHSDIYKHVLKINRDASSMILPEGGHFLFHKNKQAAESVLGFLRRDV